MDEYSRELSDFYEQLSEQPDRIPTVTLHHSAIHYVRAHLNSKFDKNYTTQEVYDLLDEEGLLENYMKT